MKDNQREIIFRHFSDIIDSLISDSLFFEYYFQKPFSLEDSIEGGYYWENIPEHIQICSGATRGCIVDFDYDWVVKYDIEEDYFGSACEREEDIYDNAKKANVDKYFAEMMYIGNYHKKYYFYNAEKIERYCNDLYISEKDFDDSFMENEEKFGAIETITVDIPLYAYRRATSFTGSSRSKECTEQARTIKSPLSYRNIDVAISFIEHYGFDEYKKLTAFSIKHHINDLHSGNIGIIDNQPVMIDYSGYHCYSEDDEEDGMPDDIIGYEEEE